MSLGFVFKSHFLFFWQDTSPFPAIGISGRSREIMAICDVLLRGI